MGPSPPQSVSLVDQPVSHYGQSVRPELIHSCYYSALRLFINYLESYFTNQNYKATRKLPYNSEN